MLIPGSLSLKRNPIDILLFVGCCLALTAAVLWGPIALDVTCLLLLALSLAGGANSILALLLCTAVRFLNPALAHPSEYTGLIFWLILITAFLRNFAYVIKFKYINEIWPIWLMAFWAMISSIIASHSLAISLLKIFSFTIGSTLAVTIAKSVPDKDYSALGRQIATLYLFVVAASFPLIFIPGIGFALNHVGFQGIFNQPQSLGIFLAPATAFLLTRLVERRSVGVATSIVSVFFAISLYETRARTALLATILSCAIAILIGVLRNSKYNKVKLSAAKLALFSIISAVALSSAFVYSESFRAGIYSFVFKHEEKKSLGNAFQESRGELLEKQMRNFEESPIWGNGFGVSAENNTAQIKSDFPLSAPVEKGFIFTAVLEEAGVIGAALFLFAVFYISWQATSAASASLLAVLLGSILINFGESVFFSLGGVGLHFWILIGYILGGVHRQRKVHFRPAIQPITCNTATL